MKKKNTVFMAVTMVILTIGWVATAWAGGNPPNPGDEKTTGPVVQGTLEFTPSNPEDLYSLVEFSFYGTCKGQDIIIEKENFDDVSAIGAISPETLINGRFNDFSVLPSKCVPKSAYELIVSRIRSFEDFTDMKVAEVMMFFVVPK